MFIVQEYFTPQGVAGSIVPAISPLLLDVSVTVRDQAKISMDSFMKTVIDEADRMKVGEELEAKERELKHALGDVDDAGVNEAVLASSSGGHSTTGYASSLTAWASSAMASNVNKLVGIGASSPAVPALSASAAAPSSHSSSFSSTKTEGNGASSLTTSSSKHNSLNTFPAKDGWNDNDDDLDGLDSPKRSSSSFSAPLSVNRGTRSSSASPATSSLSKSMSSSTSSVKLSVSRTPAANATTSASRTLATSTFAMDAADSEWGDDNWGADDELGFSASAPEASRLGVGALKGVSGTNSSSLMTSATLTPGTSIGSSLKEKTASGRRAEAQVKGKAKREQLGAMKLSATASEKADNWNWDF